MNDEKHGSVAHESPEAGTVTKSPIIVAGLSGGLNLANVNGGDPTSPFGSRTNRERYKLKTREVGNRRSTYVWARDRSAEPRHTTLAQHVRKYGYGHDFQVSNLLPEWLHDRLFVKRICGSKFFASLLENEFSAIYLVHVWVIILILPVVPVIGLAALGSALSTDNSTPTWFPYMGASFYILFVPIIELGILLESTCANTVLNVDDKTLKWFGGIATALCFVCSPVYGTWALTNLSENATFDENLGLYIGAYSFCALSVPVWILPVLVASFFITDEYRSNEIIPRVLFTMVGLCVNGVVIGSMIHQAIVGELIWFPYLGVVGLLSVIPPFCFMIGFAVLGLADPYVGDWLGEAGGVIIMAVIYMAVTDGIAWTLSHRNLTQPIELLIEDHLLYGGAICFYIAASISALYFWVHFASLAIAWYKELVTYR